MLSVKSIREQIGAEHDKCEALVALAETEKRELTEDEKSTFDGARAEFTRLESEELPRAEFLETKRAELAKARTAPPLTPAGDETHKAPVDRVSQIVIPATCRRRGRLVAFKGEHAEKAAYLSGRFYAALIFDHDPSKVWCEENGVSIRQTLKEGSNTKGGVLVPAETMTAIIDLQETFGLARQKLRIVPMGGDTKTQPRRKSGPTAYYVGEQEEITASDKTWDSISLTARKLASLVKYSSELDEDAFISIAEDLTREFALAFSSAEDDALFLGDATSTYGGITGLITAVAAATASVITAATGNTAFSTLDLLDFENMIGALPMFAGINPEWYISKVGWAASMMRLTNAAGGNNFADIQAGRQLQFLGFPVNLTQKMNNTTGAQTSTAGLCYYGDLRMAGMFGDRRALTIKSSAERYIELDQLVIVGTERYDINLHDVGDTSSAGPVIMLSTPSS